MNDWLKIHALADECLEGEEKAAAEELVAGSPACRAEYEAIQTIKRTIKAKAEVHTSHAVWTACRQRLIELEKRRHVERFVGKYAWGMTSIFFAAILGAAIMNRTMPRHSLATGDLAQISSGLGQYSQGRSQPEDMRSWIHETPVTLDVGGMRPLYWESVFIKDRWVKNVVVSDGNGRFTLIVMRGEEHFEGAEPMTCPGNYCALRMDGGNGVTWTDQGYTLTVLGPRSLDEMLKVAELIRIKR